MCFITYLSGGPSRRESRNVGQKKVNKKDSLENFYEAIPVHKRPDLIDEAINLINLEWSKSRCQRLWSLGSSRNELPTSLIVILKTNQIEQAEKSNESSNKKTKTMPNETQIIHDLFFNQPYDKSAIVTKTGKVVQVLAHIRLLPVPSDNKACFFESMVVAPEFRGLGIGSFLIRAAEKYCEKVLKLKRIYLSTYDAGVFYMKMDYEITPAVCVFGSGEVNTVTKKVYLKKTLDYVEEPDTDDTDEIQEYDVKKDSNYNEQLKMDNDVVFSGLPFRPDNDKVIAESLCNLFSTPLSLVKYFYSFEHLSRSEEIRKQFFVLSFHTKEAKDSFMKNGYDFGVLCFQHLFKKPVNEWDNVLLNFTHRLTKMNLIIKKELINLKKENVITNWGFKDSIFYALQNEDLINVCNLGILELLRMQDEPEIEEESIGWETPEELERELKSLESFAKQLKKNSLKGNVKYKWLAPVQNENDEDSNSEEEREDSEERQNSYDENLEQDEKPKANNSGLKKKSRRQSLSCFIINRNSQNSNRSSSENEVTKDAKDKNEINKTNNKSFYRSRKLIRKNEKEKIRQSFTQMIDPQFEYLLSGLQI